MDAKVNKNEVKNISQCIEIPTGYFSSGNCIGCIYYYPNNRDSNGRSYCGWYDTYYYPRERGGCLSRKD